jgi:hypothetical protein
LTELFGGVWNLLTIMPFLKSAVVAFALVFAGFSSGVPFAQGAVHDLSTEGTIVVPTATGGAIFTTSFLKTAGTGKYEPFLTIAGDGGVERGYNTSSGVFDTQRAPQWNHEITVGDLESTRFTYMGADYYSFTLDINEPNGGSSSLISLDALKIYLSSTPNQTTTNIHQLGTLVFDLDSISNQTVLYDDAVSGSGQADIAFFIPAAAFNGVPLSTLVYMYQEFGGYGPEQMGLMRMMPPDYSASGGYEETRLVAGIRPVPEPSAVLPLAGVLGLVLTSRRLWRVVG